jgi:hypothetical protein
VLSGTLSLAFNQLNADPEMPFSQAYQLASALVDVDERNVDMLQIHVKQKHIFMMDVL